MLYSSDFQKTFPKKAWEGTTGRTQPEQHCSYQKERKQGELEANNQVFKGQPDFSPNVGSATSFKV